MAEKNKWQHFGVKITTFTIVISVAAIMAGCKRHPHEPTQTKDLNEPATTQPEAPKADTEHPKIDTEPAKVDVKPAPARFTLSDVIRAARYWRPVYTSWYGRAAPDFALPDLAGKEHKLSDYRGKDVLLIFWATWCPPCQMELPHLIELRNTTGENKLVMLGVSNEKADVVQKFADDRGINYTILLDQGNMPQPFGFRRIYSMTGVPCSFFIDAQGRIKLATSGLLSLSEMKAVLQAE
jgi:peroxiredoxin